MINWLKRVFLGETTKPSAQIARERLMVIVAHERGQHEEQPDFLPMLQKELTEVIAKYVKVSKDQVHVDFEQKGGRSVFELNITFPDVAAVAAPVRTQAEPPLEPKTTLALKKARKKKPATPRKKKA